MPRDFKITSTKQSKINKLIVTKRNAEWIFIKLPTENKFHARRIRSLGRKIFASTAEKQTKK